MEVVSTLNLVYLDTKRTTTACHFQTMIMNVFVMPHDLMRGQIGSYELCKYEAICNSMMTEL